MKPKIIRVLLSEDEKRSRAEEFNKIAFETQTPMIDVEDYVKREIYEDSVALVCPQCDFSTFMEYEEYMLESSFGPIECPQCEKGHLVLLETTLNEKK